MMRAALLVTLALGALLTSTGSGAGAADQPAVLLYASDWLGPMRILVADPTGGREVRQLTFQHVEATCGLSWACGTEDPTPSPDGRVLAYRKSGELWFARPDGSHPHRVARTRVEALAWSRDSRRLAYTTYDGLHVVGPTGREDRRVPIFRASELAWSADGRAIAGRDGSRISVLRDGRTTLVATNAGIGAPSLAWLPKGRISFTTGSLWSETKVVTVAATGLGPQRNLGPGWGPAWTPDGRLVAVSTRNGIEVIDPATTGRRSLSRESGFDLEWSPDGRTLAYIQGSVTPGGDIETAGDLRTVTLARRVRTVLAADHRYGGQIVSLAWTRPPAGTRYRAPVPDDGVFAGGPVSALAADGGRVAYGACRHVYAWTPAATKTEQVDVPSAAPCSAYSRVDALAVAGDRVAWRDRGPGLNTWEWSLHARSLSTGDGSLGSGVFRANARPWFNPLVGAGSFLAFATPPDFFARPLSQTLRRVDGVSCPCPEIKAAEGGTPDDPPLVPLDVDDGRLIVRRFDDLVLVLDRGGATSMAVSVSPETMGVVPASSQLDEGQLDGDALVSHVGDELLQHEIVKGALVHRWPLPRLARLQDARGGLVAYVLEGEIRMLRLSDGATAAVAPGSLARFFDRGLAYAEGARVRVIDFDRLPLR